MPATLTAAVAVSLLGCGNSRGQCLDSRNQIVDASYCTNTSAVALPNIYPPFHWSNYGYGGGYYGGGYYHTYRPIIIPRFGGGSIPRGGFGSSFGGFSGGFG